MPRLYRRAAGRRQPLSLRPGGRGLMAGMEAVQAAPVGDDGRMDMDAF